MTRIYVDSADLEEIIPLITSAAVEGVTTNPSLMAKTKNEGANGSEEFYFDRLRDLFTKLKNHVSWRQAGKHISVEVITASPNEMIEQAFKIKDLYLDTVAKHEQKKFDFHVKIPISIETLPVISSLENNGLKVNATACMTSMQALMAHQANASIISFFYNRIKDEKEHPDKAILDSISLGVPEEKIICGSIRKVSDVSDCIDLDVGAVTVSYKIIKEMMSHPQTTKAINNFQKDIDKWLGKE